MKKVLSNVTLIAVATPDDLERTKLAADICEKYFSFGKVKILTSSSDTDKRIIPIQEINSWKAYCEFCITDMWKYVDTEFILLFQYDGFILNPDAWTDEFLNYDYIGAPWYHFGKPLVGNGGFTLRSKRLLNYIRKNYEKIGGELSPEDLWICRDAKPFLEKEGMKFAPLELAEKFSKEGNEHGVFWNGEFGFHGIKYTDISKWLEKNPKYKELLPQKFDDFITLMQKYTIYDGTFHVLQCKPIQVDIYKKLSIFEKNYDCRIYDDIQYLDDIKPSHKIVYKLFRISVTQVGIPTFERIVKKVEIFSSKNELLKTYPDIEITPSFYLRKWRQRLGKILGNVTFPIRKNYTILWFEEK